MIVSSCFTKCPNFAQGYLAATYVKLRTGREPFGDNPPEIMRRQTAGDPILDGLQPAEADLVRAALAAKPEDRPQQGARACVKQIYRIGSGGQPSPHASHSVPVPKKPILQVGHTSAPKWAAYSPDGRRIVTASVDHTARVWDAATGQQLLGLQGHTSWVDSARYSPDGRRIVTASEDGSARLWDAAGGKQIVELVATRQGDWVAVTPDGYFVASKGAESLVRHSDGQGGLIPEEESLRYHRPDLVQEALEQP